MKVRPPTVSVVIPCRNERDYIESCIHSVLNQEPTPGGFEIIIVDGMSEDGTREVLKELVEDDPRIRVVDNPSGMVSTGLNTAIQLARGQIIIRMDAHTEYASDYIRQCVAVLQETGADNVGGPARTKSTGYMQSAICAAYHSPFSVGGARFHNAGYEGYLDTVPYGCWRREVFDRIGLFDEELVRNQDDEFNLRLIRAGGKIWQSPRIKSWYIPRASLVKLFEQYFQYGYWKVWVIQKHKVPASVRHLVPPGFLLLLGVLPCFSLFWSPVFWGWLGIGGLYVASNLVASSFSAVQRGLKIFPVLPLVFTCFHLGYGLGFLRGVWDLIIFRRGASPSFTKITRTTMARSYGKGVIRP